MSVSYYRVTFDSPPEEVANKGMWMNCSERSMMMNALAIKYLPNEELGRMMPNVNGFGASNQPVKYVGSPSTPTTPFQPSKSTIHHTPTNLSMASYRYMEKYGLLGS